MTGRPSWSLGSIQGFRDLLQIVMGLETFPPLKRVKRYVKKKRLHRALPAGYSERQNAAICPARCKDVRCPILLLPACVLRLKR
jgi:hypothetical protein